MTDRVVTVPDSLELPEDVKVPSARLSDSTAAGRALLDAADAAAQRTALGLGTAATTPATDYATAAQGAKADAGDVAQITLTGNLALTIPEGHPAGQVYRCAITQTTGGHTVTYGGAPVAVDTTAGAVTTVELHPTGSGWVVRYPLVASAAGKTLVAAADAAAQRTALGLGTAATTAATDYAPRDGNPGNVTWQSTAAGGDDDFDSTSRLTLESYQTGGSNNYGESLRLVMRGDHSKQMIAWQDGFSTAERIANPKSVVWAGAHYGAQEVDQDNPEDTIHGHWSLEVPGADGALRTRFEILYVDDTTKEVGVDQTIIRTGGADFIVTANGATGGSGEGNALRVAAANAWHKDIVFSNERGRGNSYRRWVLRANNTTDDASHNGSDFEILRQTASATELPTALFIKRSNGRVAFGGNRSPQAGVHLQETEANMPMLGLFPTITLTNPAIRVDMQTNQETALASRVAGDAHARVIFRTDGKLEWGDGTAIRDVILWRVGAGVLRTEDTFDAQKNIRIGATSTAKTSGTAGGVGVLAMFNAATVPTGTPSGGVLYVENGALMYRGSSGTVTMVAPA